MAINSAEDGGVADLAQPEYEERKPVTENGTAIALLRRDGEVRAVGRCDRGKPTADRFGNGVLA